MRDGIHALNAAMTGLAVSIEANLGWPTNFNVEAKTRVRWLERFKANFEKNAPIDTYVQRGGFRVITNDPAGGYLPE